MKSLVVLFVVALVGVTLAVPSFYPNGCIYVEGRCMSGCEDGTYAYTTGCNPVTPEPSCAVPNPVPEEGDICDFTACYCNPPTVRHPETNKCVPLEECPKVEQKEALNVKS